MEMTGRNELTLGSVTYAIKAKRILEAEGIRTAVKKTNRRAQNTGCSWGISFPEIDRFRVLSILDGAGLKVRSKD